MSKSRYRSRLKATGINCAVGDGGIIAAPGGTVKGRIVNSALSKSLDDDGTKQHYIRKHKRGCSILVQAQAWHLAFIEPMGTVDSFHGQAELDRATRP